MQSCPTSALSTGCPARQKGISVQNPCAVTFNNMVIHSDFYLFTCKNTKSQYSIKNKARNEAQKMIIIIDCANRLFYQTTDTRNPVVKV